MRQCSKDWESVGLTMDASRQPPNDLPSDENPPEPAEEQDFGYRLYSGEETRDERDLYSFRIRPDTAPLNPLDLEPKVPQTPAANAVPRLATGKILLFSALGAVVALLLAVSIRILFSPPHPQDDLGDGVFAAAGLRGHLIAKWEGSAQYLLRIEPIGMQQRDGFAAVAVAPPRPLSVKIQLMDASGFALCGKQILLKFDPTQSVLDKSDAGAVPTPPDAAQLQLREIERERGNDLFRNETGSDGKIAAIVAQGNLPCSEKEYRRMDSWDFSSDFPLLAEQTALLQPADSPAKKTSKSVPSKKGSSGGNFLSAPIEGDDVITGFAPSRGVAETRGGRVFIIGGGGLEDYATGWQVFPAAVHFRCDKKAACIITRAGASTVLHARLKR